MEREGPRPEFCEAACSLGDGLYGVWRGGPQRVFCGAVASDAAQDFKAGDHVMLSRLSGESGLNGMRGHVQRHLGAASRVAIGTGADADMARRLARLEAMLSASAAAVSAAAAPAAPAAAVEGLPSLPPEPADEDGKRGGPQREFCEEAIRAAAHPLPDDKDIDDGHSELMMGSDVCNDALHTKVESDNEDTTKPQPMNDALGNDCSGMGLDQDYGMVGFDGKAANKQPPVKRDGPQREFYHGPTGRWRGGPQREFCAAAFSMAGGLYTGRRGGPQREYCGAGDHALQQPMK